MAWENTSNEDLFIAICAFRLDRNCSTDTFVSVVQEAERRVESSIPKSDLRKLVEEMKEEGESQLDYRLMVWAVRLKKLLEGR